MVAPSLLQTARSRPLLVLSVLVLLIVLPAHLAVAVGRDVAGWGWDEAMHAALPAARILVGVQMGELGQAADALAGCDRYPFVFPLILAAGQGVVGIGQDEARWVALLKVSRIPSAAHSADARIPLQRMAHPPAAYWHPTCSP